MAAVADAISTALAFPQGNRVDAGNELARAIADANSGDTNRLNNLINTAETLRQTDGQFVNSCSDALNRPTPDRVRELVVEWVSATPVRHGRRARHGQVPQLAERHRPEGTSGLTTPTLLLGVQNDPIVGSEGVAAVAATAINAGSTNKRVMWQGIGHGASIYSPCALPPVLAYLDSGQLPATDTYCPA